MRAIALGLFGRRDRWPARRTPLFPLPPLPHQGENNYDERTITIHEDPS